MPISGADLAMAEGRDYTHTAYQAPWIERHGRAAGGAALLLLLVAWLLIAKPWEYQRAGTPLTAEAPQRLSTAADVYPMQARPTRRVAIHGAAVYVTWADTRTDPPSLLLAVSTDAGKTFTERIIASPDPTRRLSDPAILTDSQGSLYLLYTYTKSEERETTKTRIMGQRSSREARPAQGIETASRIARSDDAGETWAAVSTIGSAFTPAMFEPVMGIDAANIVYVAAIGQVQGQDQVVVTKSASRGESFEPDLQVSTAPKGTRRDLAIAVSPAGRVAVLWSDRRNTPELPENGEIFGALANAGREFSEEMPLIAGALKPARQRYPEVLLRDSGELSVLFVEGVDRERRDRTVLRYAHSRTFGQSFDAPVTLFAKQLANPDAPQLAMGRDGQCYLTCSGTLTDLNQPTLLLAHSRDGGRTFRGLTPIVERFSPLIGMPALAVQDNTIVVSYFDTADPSAAAATQEVYAVRVTDGSVRE